MAELDYVFEINTMQNLYKSAPREPQARTQNLTF